MIITLTPNPSLDLLFGAQRLVWDDANRVPMPRRRPGGQGINVVRAARALGAEQVHAVAPLGGPVGEELEGMLAAEGTPLTAVPIAGETRVFVGVRESATGRALLLNPRGPEITADELEALSSAVDGVLEDAPEGAWFAPCGSTLPGMPPELYLELGTRASERGVRFVPDCDGPALALAVPEADMIVPNAQEAGRLVRRAVADVESALLAARTLRDRGPDRVAVTLGRDDAVLVTDEGEWWARAVAPEDRAEVLTGASAVGAGDAFLAALLLALDDGAEAPDALAGAVAAGTAVLLSHGDTLVAEADVEEVRGWVEVQSPTG